MINAHAIIGPGSAILLLAAIGLIVGVVVLTLSAMARKRRLTGPEPVPLWWDQSPAPSTSVVPNNSLTTRAHG